MSDKHPSGSVETPAAELLNEVAIAKDQTASPRY